MKIFYADHIAMPLPEGHRFPGQKYALLREAVMQLKLPGIELCIPEPASDEQLLLAHTPEYLAKVIEGTLTEKEIRRMGFPWSPELVERSRRSVGGSIAACRAALQDGYSVNLGGGTHHAYPDHGEGFCVFNDVAVAVRAVQAQKLASQAVIIDTDVHQGNGTAAIFKGDPSVYTFSIHGEKNFPFHKEAGRLDIALPDKSGDADFLEALYRGTRKSLEESHADLAIYLAGADPYVGDRLGRLAVTKDGLAERDRIVFDLCERYRLPVAVVMGGGYARDIHDTVEIQLQTIREAARRAVRVN